MLFINIEISLIYSEYLRNKWTPTGYQIPSFLLALLFNKFFHFLIHLLPKPTKFRIEVKKNLEPQSVIINKTITCPRAEDEIKNIAVIIRIPGRINCWRLKTDAPDRPHYLVWLWLGQRKRNCLVRLCLVIKIFSSSDDNSLQGPYFSHLLLGDSWR